MSFIKHLNNNYIRDPLYFGDVVLSVQAGVPYYSLPKEDLDINEYTHFEVGLSNCNSTKVKRILKPYLECDQGNLIVYTYVPKPVVEKVFNLLSEIQP